MKKTCSKCGVEKVVGEFNKSRSRPDGMNHECKACVSARGSVYREANREKLNTKTAAWRAENPERVKAWGVARRLGLPDQYVKFRLGPNPPPELIELKRISIQIKRELKRQEQVA